MNNKTQPTKSLESPHRLSYLLRLWRTNGPGSLNWQASLEIPETGKRIGFASLEQLFAYLMDVIEGRLNKQCTPGKEHSDETGSRN